MVKPTQKNLFLKKQVFYRFSSHDGSHEKRKICNEIPMTMEGCVVRMADTISYIGRDLEDAIRLDLVKRQAIPDVCKQILGQTNGTIVFNLVTDLISNSLDHPFIGFSEKVSSALKKLKAFNYKHIYKNPVIKKHLSSIEDIFNFLFEKYLTALEKGDEQSIVFTGFLNGMSQEYRQSHSNPEIVRDYISGMTDSYFIRQAPVHLRPASIENV